MYNRNTNTISLIVQSPIAPRSNNVLWDDGTNIKIWRKGIWVPIGGGGSSDSYWGYDEVENAVFITGYNKVQINCDLVVNGNISSKNWNAMWELSEDGTQIFTTKQVLIKNNLIVEGDTSSGGAGEDIPGYGASSMSQLEDVDLSSLGNNYVLIYDSSSSKWVSKPQSEIVHDLSGYLKIEDANTTFVKLDTFNTLTDEVSTLNTKVTLVHNWYNAISPYWYYDTELEAIVCTKNLIVYLDTSSGGEGEDTPASGGIRGIYVNGTPYTDEDGDGFIDLGTISGGGGVSGDYLPLTGGRITGNSLDIGREDNYASAFVKIITNASTSADYGTSIRHYEKSSGSYTYKGLLIDKNGAYYSNNGSNYGLIHSGNYSSFALPLSGGTLYNGVSDTPLYIKSDKGAAYIGFKNSSDAFLGYYGFNDTTPTVYIGTSAEYNIIHSGNIGSHKAGGLATPRTIWGQSFDGTGNVSGTIDPIASSSFHCGTNTNQWYSVYTMYLLAKSSSSLSIGANNSTHMLINTSGNVTIGDSDLAGTSAKLSVDGSFTMWGAYQNEMPTLGDFTNARFKLYGYGNRTTQNWGLFAAAMNSGNAYLQVGGDFGDTLAYNLLLNPLGGYVGIGTDSPQHQLDVNGNIATNQYLCINAWTGYGSGSCNMWYNGNTLSLNMGSRLKMAYGLTIDSEGASITGAVTMSSTLTVGDATNTSTVSSTYVTINTTTSGGWERAIRFQQNGSNKFCLGSYGTGSVMYYGYIGTSYTAPWVKFTPTQMTVNGDAIITGDTSSGSDIRFKDIIKNKAIKIEDIAKAPLFTFKWNDRDDDTIHLGSSAQYWENICPWLVTGEDFKTLNYGVGAMGGVISLARHDLQQDKKIKAQGKEIKALKRTVKVMEKEVKRLKEEMRYGDR